MYLMHTVWYDGSPLNSLGRPQWGRVLLAWIQGADRWSPDAQSPGAQQWRRWWAFYDMFSGMNSSHVLGLMRFTSRTWHLNGLNQQEFGIYLHELKKLNDFVQIHKETLRFNETEAREIGIQTSKLGNLGSSMGIFPKKHMVWPAWTVDSNGDMDGIQDLGVWKWGRIPSK